ncbi:GNAT family N-acetyltransferase [Dongia sedimenti]|uniref:GNAT family N-acetyltransferase n=1 Tax=Dongia sedimenti TaxID=3064282 RepID=A0ABU0YMQ3_9PROT|nr:GNAT family N-acetyltransferase [Rhodospirillaceae bacterium R-7]
MCSATSPRRRRSEAVVLRAPLPADHLEIAALIESLIPRYLARDLTAEGVAIVRANAQPGLIGARLGGLVYPVWSPACVTAVGSRIIGFGAVRDATHITQVQVAEGWHGCGIGSRLVRALIEGVQRRNPQAQGVTLNAASGALAAYLRMGFVPVGPRWTWRGVTAQPMRIRIAGLIQRKAAPPPLDDN